MFSSVRLTVPASIIRWAMSETWLAPMEPVLSVVLRTVSVLSACVMGMSVPPSNVYSTSPAPVRVREEALWAQESLAL